MPMKSIILIAFLAAVVFIAPQANAQTGIIKINGTVFCSLTGAPIVGATIPTPPFANATVQLTMNGVPMVEATTTTNSQGRFTIDLALNVTVPLTGIASQAAVVVATPLTACNASLPENTFLRSKQLQVLSNDAFCIVVRSWEVCRALR